MMWLISLTRNLSICQNRARTKKAATDLHLCPHMLVFSHLMCHWQKANPTIGAPAATRKSVLSVTVNASGSWRVFVLSLSTLANLATTNFATARCQLMRLSATGRISTFSSGPKSTIVVSGASGALLLSGPHLLTGGWLSTDDHITSKCNVQTSYHLKRFCKCSL